MAEPHEFRPSAYLCSCVARCRNRSTTTRPRRHHRGAPSPRNTGHRNQHHNDRQAVRPVEARGSLFLVPRAGGRRRIVEFGTNIDEI